MNGQFVLYHDPVGRIEDNAPAGLLHGYDTGSESGAGLPDLVAEYADRGGRIARRYVHGPGTDEPLVWYEGSGTGERRFLHADERGSIVAVTDNAGNVLTDSAGKVIGINRYDEYGKPAPGNLGRFQYTGQKWIPELGMYDFKARNYNPWLGRFMQTDPIGYDDGMNLYAYVGGDPVNFADPYGLEAFVPGYENGWNIYGRRPSASSGGGIIGSSRERRFQQNAPIESDGSGSGGIPAGWPGSKCRIPSQCAANPVPKPNPKPKNAQEQKLPPRYCSSTSHKLGDFFGGVGETITWVGLGASALGGPEFLPLAGLGGVISTSGDIASAYAGDPRAGRRLAVSTALFGVGSIFIPRSVKGTITDAVISQGIGKGATAAIDKASQDACK